MIDHTTLARSGEELLATATELAGHAAPTTPPDGGWGLEQILGHLTIVNATTLAAIHAVQAGSLPAYDNRISQDPWTIGRAIRGCGGARGLIERLRAQLAALSAVAATLTDDELSTRLHATLVSGEVILVDEPLSVAEIIDGLGHGEYPGHRAQLTELTGPS